jgi:hypothetical protein
MTDDRRRDEGFRAAGRIGSRGSSRRPLAGTVIVAGLLALAILTPWTRPARPEPIGRPSSPAPSVPAASAVPVPSSETDALDPAFPVGPRTNEALVTAASERFNWGMRAIVQSRRGVLAGPRLIEHWASADVRGGGAPIPGAYDEVPLADPLDDLADVAYALGVTTPPDSLALDIRFWRTSEDRGWVRLLPQPIPGPEPGSWLWRPDPAWSTIDGTWPSGIYRVDVLLGPRIVRLEAALAGTSRAETQVVMPGRLDAPIGTALEPLPPGPFVLTEYGPAEIPLATSGTFDELDAWLAPYLGKGFVAQAYGANVNGLGVLVGRGAPPIHLSIEQVSGVPRPSLLGLDLSTVDAGERSAIVARPLGGHLFSDGLYRITAEWPGGRTEDWEVEVGPGIPPGLPTAPLEALSRWTIATRPGGAAAPVVTIGGADGDPTFASTCDPATRITAGDALIGVRLPAGARLTGVRVLVLGADRTIDRRFHFASIAVPGLTVVAVPEGGLAARDYDLVLDLDGPDGPWRVLQRICVVD